MHELVHKVRAKLVRFIRASRVFQVKENELEHERKIEEAIRKIEQLSTTSSKVSSVPNHPNCV